MPVTIRRRHLKIRRRHLAWPAVAVTALTALLGPAALPTRAEPRPHPVADDGPEATQARPTAEEPSRRRGLFLTVAGEGNTWVRGVLLDCPTGTGTHPDGARACAALQRARGDLDALPVDRHACTKEYDPVTATATGTWRGTPVAWHKTFPNACALDTATGPLFRF